MVDWERVEAELATIDEDYKSRVRFDPAPHVVKILSSIDPDDELRKVCDSTLYLICYMCHS